MLPPQQGRRTNPLLLRIVVLRRLRSGWRSLPASLTPHPTLTPRRTPTQHLTLTHILILTHTHTHIHIHNLILILIPDPIQSLIESRCVLLSVLEDTFCCNAEIDIVAR